MTATDTSLAATAQWTAAVRAAESARPDRLFDDPWAAALAGETGSRWLAARPPAGLTPIVLRTRYFDDYLQRIAATCVVRQFVLPGAGLDTRAFRLGWPEGTTLFEVDQPAVLDYKESVLRECGARPQCERVAVRCDVRDDWVGALRSAGYTAEQPSGWLLEGFLFYLPVAAVESLLEQVATAAAPGSWLGFDIVNRDVLTSPLTRAWVEMQAAEGAAWIGTLDDPVVFLARLGWQAELSQAGQPKAHHGRWTLPVIPTTMPNMPHNWFVVARKGEP